MITFFSQGIYQRVFNFRCAESVAADVNNIIHSPSDLIMTITMTYSTVSREIETFIWTEIRVQESAVRTIDGASHSGPRFLHAQSTSHVVFHHLFSLQIDIE